MGTRSSITVKMTDGTFKSVYCHFDGYLDHNGKMLTGHYNSQDRAEALVEHGDLSVIYQHCDKPEGHTFDNPVDGRCKYYGRDRGEEGTAARVGATPEESNKGNGQEFDYLWDGEKWNVSSGYFNEGKLMPLADAFLLEAEE